MDARTVARLMLTGYARFASCGEIYIVYLFMLNTSECVKTIFFAGELCEGLASSVFRFVDVMEVRF